VPIPVVVLGNDDIVDALAIRARDARTPSTPGRRRSTGLSAAGLSAAGLGATGLGATGLGATGLGATGFGPAGTALATRIGAALGRRPACFRASSGRTRRAFAAGRLSTRGRVTVATRPNRRLARDSAGGPLAADGAAGC